MSRWAEAVSAFPGYRQVARRIECGGITFGGVRRSLQIRREKPRLAGANQRTPWVVAPVVQLVEHFLAWAQLS
jgi:hypothetical protein